MPDRNPLPKCANCPRTRPHYGAKDHAFRPLACNALFVAVYKMATTLLSSIGVRVVHPVLAHFNTSRAYQRPIPEAEWELFIADATEVFVQKISIAIGNATGIADGAPIFQRRIVDIAPQQCISDVVQVLWHTVKSLTVLIPELLLPEPEIASSLAERRASFGILLGAQLQYKAPSR